MHHGSRPLLKKIILLDQGIDCIDSVTYTIFDQGMENFAIGANQQKSLLSKQFG